ncbi:MAG TPA: hypothetical protein VGM10_29135 [Actinocrinis sp.]
MTARLSGVGLQWHASGQSSLHGPLLDLAERLDEAFALLADRIWRAQAERHPATLPAAALQRLDYLYSFPHQATFPMRLDRAEANLEAFRSGPMVGLDGVLALTELAAPLDVLTPAACYHLYHGHEGEQLGGPLFLTTRNTCFRQEAAYEPLRRQWSFTMREIVCLGTGSEAAAFLENAHLAVDRLLKGVGLPVEWQAATDPFFNPRSDPRYLMQRMQPVKREAVYGGDLAIASANLHHEHFGDAFSIARDGGPAHSACMAFGIERWLFAVVDQHGTDPAAWPDPIEAAEAAAAAQEDS